MSETLKDILDKINKTWFLPTLQRDFVWLKNAKKMKIEKLFDSLMLGYPIGQIVLWKLSSDMPDLMVYKFLDSYKTNGKNECGSISVSKDKIENLVLDGQQRLTSLYLCLNGSSYIEDNSGKKYLYINLLYSEEREIVDDVTYQFEFKTPEAANFYDENNLWYRVSDIMNESKVSDATDFSSEYIERERNDEKLSALISCNEKQIKKTLSKLWDNIRNKQVNIETVNSNDLDKILEIFVRLNDGGVVLEKSDLLLSFMESKKNLFGTAGAREEISSFVDTEINERNCGIESKVKLQKDLFLKACLMLSDLPLAYNKTSFSNDNLQILSKFFSKNKKIITIVYKLLDKYNFTENTITAKNALLPIAYYLKIKKLNNDVFIKSKENKDVEERNKIILWLAKVLLTGEFGGSSDSTLKQYRENINSTKELNFIGKNKLIRKNIEDVVKGAVYKGKNTQLILFLTTDSKYWETSQDHIFAQNKFESEPLSHYKKDMNSVANLQLLSIPENSRKKEADTFEWAQKHPKEVIKNNLYPPKVKLEDSNFKEFIKAREKLLIDKLCEIFEIQ